jgi:hypothetical protein
MLNAFENAIQSILRQDIALFDNVGTCAGEVATCIQTDTRESGFHLYAKP